MSAEVSMHHNRSGASKEASFIHPKVLSLIATYKCTAACRHCCFNSNRSRSKRLTLDEMENFINVCDEAPSVECIVFTGGECFLLGKDLIKAVEFASKKGLSTRCVTNGYWAESPESARKRLRPLKDAGLGELNISTGDYHQEWISEKSVLNAAEAAVELELKHTMIIVERYKGCRVTARRLAANDYVRALYEASSTSKARFDIIESPWMPMDYNETIEQTADLTANGKNAHLRGGCRSIFTTIAITPHKDIGICCGLSRDLIPELNLPPDTAPLLKRLAESSTDFIKIWLFVDGPEKILSWAASKNPGIDWERRYGHPCQACLALYKNPIVKETVLEHHHERVTDVLLRYNVKLKQQDMLDAQVYG